MPSSEQASTEQPRQLDAVRLDQRARPHDARVDPALITRLNYELLGATLPPGVGAQPLRLLRQRRPLILPFPFPPQRWWLEHRQAADEHQAPDSRRRHGA